MFAVLRFFFFNVILPGLDVGTDFWTFFELLPGDPRWAFLTLTWTVMPFCVRLVFYLFRKGAGTLKRCDTWSELGSQFNKEVISHLPLVSSLHNIMRTRRLHQLKFGTNKFKMSNHKEVEGILADAGSTSEGESNYEAGRIAHHYAVFLCSLDIEI